MGSCVGVLLGLMLSVGDGVLEGLRRILAGPDGFGGSDFRDLHVTSATQGLSAAELQDGGKHGQTFVLHDLAQGRAEPRVIL